MLLNQVFKELERTFDLGLLASQGVSGPRPHRAETGENDPVSFYAVQEYLLKDGFM
jgi:hypothetical protein